MQAENTSSLPPPRVSPQIGRPGVSSSKDVRKCVIFYRGVFALVWTLASASMYLRVHREGKAFGVTTQAVLNADHPFGDFLEFDPADEHFRSPHVVKGQNYTPPM